jgi:class 3 adenylate cyclase
MDGIQTFGGNVTARQELVQAIAALELQRSLLGDPVVDTALWALRQRLTALPAPVPRRNGHQQQQLTVLVADLSGFTAMAERLDAEQVRDMMNLVWSELDGVIEAWGGRVDQHAGDSMVAHFGLPHPRTDDPLRAVEAALEMHMVLALLNARLADPAGQEGANGSLGGAWANPDLHMRIGVHTGPVFLGEVGAAHAYTAVGDAVTIANLLEQAAPVGKTLISEDVYRTVREHFVLEATRPVLIPEKRAVLPVFVVERARPRPFREPPPQIAGVSSRLIGRDAQLEQLQDALHAAVDGSASQVVLLVGEDGCGKSRLLDEFERWLSFFPARSRLFRGRVYCERDAPPYALLRDLFNAYFDVRARHSQAVARHNLAAGITRLLAAGGAPLRTAQTYARAIGHLLGYDFAQDLALEARADPAAWVQDQAYAGLARLMTAATADGAAAVLFLEDVHAADSETLALVDFLVERCIHLPLLVVCTARAELFARRPAWAAAVQDPFSAYVRLDLPPLSPIDSRHLAGELLQKAPAASLRLLDLIVTGAQGNPFYVEEMVRLLVDVGALEPGEPHWQVHMGRLEGLRWPRSLPDLLRLRLARLPTAELAVLQKAAVFGRVFTDTAVRHLSQGAGHDLDGETLAAALIALEQQAFIYRSPLNSFGNGPEYLFRYDAWRAAAYATLPEARRRAFHHQAAVWLISHAPPDRLATFSARIAEHFALAGEEEKARMWNGRYR